MQVTRDEGERLQYLERSERARLGWLPEDALSEDEKRRRKRNHREYTRYCERKGVDGMRELWRAAAARNRENRRKRAREAYAKRAAALKLIEEMQTNGLEALT